ncbi:MAG: MmcQ/YjbR family DNA-binding protein [Gemmatimonadaceae bacterium]
MARPLPLTRLRAICLALPDATEVISHGEPTFRARGRMFATYASARNHHGKGRDAVWVKSSLVTQGLLVERHPDRIFVPQYVGHQGWIGIWLDGEVDWRMVRELIEGGHQQVTPVRKRPTHKTASPDQNG